MLSVDRLEMCNRRNKPICQGAVFLVLLGGLGYSFYSYSIISMDLEISRSETEKYFRQQESLSSQLQVVYEHRARLERSLQKEKTDHKNTKLDYSRKQNDFILNVTRSKHEAMNRFNSLETQYNMLKAQNKELDTDYNHLRQQYTRLSSEHSQLNNQQKRNYQLYKEQKTNEIASLDEEIKTLKLQVVSLRTHLKTRAEEIEQYKLSSTQALVTNQKYQETIRTLQEQLASYKERIKNAQPRNVKASKDVKEDREKTTATRHQDSVKAGVVDQEEKEKTHREKEIHTGISRSDNRHSAAKHTSQERHRRQTYVPTAPASDSDADQADQSRPDDNNNEQTQDVYGESHSDQAHDAIPLRSREEIKRNETSQGESEQRHHDNVPLRDSNEGIRLAADREPEVHVVSPTENTGNNWANIIKAAQEGDAAETEDNNGVQEEGEDENEDEWNKRLVDDHKQEAADTSRLHEGDKQKRASKEDVRDKRIGRPVAQAGDSDVRQEERRYQGDNAQRAQEQYQQRSPDDQQKEINIKNEEESHERDEQDSDLSRKIINKQVTEMQNDYQDKLIKQQEEVTLPQEQSPVYRGVAPVPAVQRQDKAEEHREQSDADNDDEDANTEQDTEKDPDDADEEDSDMLEPRESPPQQQQQQQLQPPEQVRPIQGQGQTHQDRKFERALKSAESNNNEQNEQKA